MCSNSIKSRVLSSRWLTNCRLTAFVILLTLLPLVASGQTPDVSDPATKEAVLIELRNQLKEAKTGSDSIPILYNLFDLSTGKLATDYGFQLFYTARRAANREVAFDMLRNIANINYSNDSILLIAENLAKEFRVNDDQQQTLTFIRMQRNSALGYNMQPKEKTARLQELLRENTVSPPKDLYDRIVLLHAVCVNISDISEGELLSGYLTDLGKLIQEAPSSDWALQNIYYNWASMIYTKTHQHALAIETTQKLLDVIEALDERNLQIGRIYKDYNPNRYILYTRLLENYEGLSKPEIERYYKLAMAMVDINARAKITFEKTPLPEIFHAYAHKDYQRVFEYVSKCKDSSTITSRKLQIMRMYIDAAEKIGNRQALLEAYPEYVNMLEADMDSRQAERFRELQVLYDVNEIKSENERLQALDNESRANMFRTYIYIGIATLVLLIIFVIILWRMSSRSRQLAAKLKTSNESLNKESKSLRDARKELETARDKARSADALKTDFITNMSHEVTVPLQKIQEYAEMIVENTDDAKKKYISTFADRLSLNCELVNTIINDVLQLSELSNSSLRIKEKPYDVKPICETAIDSISARVAEGVSLRLVAENAGTHGGATDDFVLTTDRHRLLQILANLLSNAAKFTTEGEITLTYGKSADHSQAVFTVTDTGRGIEPQYHAYIFDRFAKLDNTVPGAGLGLTISQMLAELLGGNLIIDPAYTLGARFILTLPLRRI